MKYMMYGFGDTVDPLMETTELVEDMTIDYITNFVSALISKDTSTVYRK